MTRSSWERAARDRRPRCCWRARAIGCCWSTRRPSRATRCRPTSCIRPALAALQRWGLLERLEATGCPPVTTYSFDFGPLTISGSPQPIDGIAHGYCPRRTVLDKLLVDAAVEAGAELREGFTVDEILADDGVGDRHSRAREGRRDASPSAPRVVIGADGRHSLVAKTVQPEQYDERPLAPGDVLRLLERPARRRVRHHDPGRGPPGLGGDPRPTTISPCSRSAGPSRSSTQTAATSRATSSRRSSSLPEFAERVRGGHAGVEVRRLGRAARLLPQALRPGLGAARRRRLPQEPDHGDGHQRRLSRRRARGQRRGRCALRGAARTRRA